MEWIVFGLGLLVAGSHALIASHHGGTGPPPLPPYKPSPYISHHGQSPYVTPYPPAYAYSPSYHPYTPAHAHAHYSPPPIHKKPEASYEPPKCAMNTTKSWCLADLEYPTLEIQQAIEYHYAAVATLYKDVIANTDNSVDRLKYTSEETYLCPSYSAYEMPLRAVNTQGKWRVVVNQVKAHYELLSQTARVEECTAPGRKCPLVPECYETKCLQKYVYHRFLVYNPYDHYFPFAVESFKLPSACACFNGDFAAGGH